MGSLSNSMRNVSFYHDVIHIPIFNILYTFSTSLICYFASFAYVVKYDMKYDLDMFSGDSVRQSKA